MLDSLIGVPVVISSSNRDKTPFRPGNHFAFPVVLVHNGQMPLAWSQAQPLHVSYRWLTPDGEVVEGEGLRTALPHSPILPGARFDLNVTGISPDNEGSYLLQLSLVLEGVHWACDVGPNGSTQVAALVTAPPAWPAELGNSGGGRALRGAMAADELARILAKRPLGNLSAEPAAVNVPSCPDKPSIATRRERRGGGWRNRLLTALGVRGLEEQLSDVIELASRQQKLALELEHQIISLREELQGTPASKARMVRSSPELLGPPKGKLR